MNILSENPQGKPAGTPNDLGNHGNSRWGVAEYLMAIVVLFGSVSALYSFLSVITKGYLPQLGAAEKAAGILDLVAFFVLTYIQFLTERRELIFPMKAALANQTILLGAAEATLETLSAHVAELNEILPGLANTRRISNGADYLKELFAAMDNAINSEPTEPRPCLRLVRLSGHWRMHSGLKMGPETVSKFFDTPGKVEETWASRWTVKIIYAVADRAILDSLERSDSILSRLRSERPTNVTFKLIVRHQFEPLIGGSAICDQNAFLAFDESTSEPFPKEGLNIRGEPVKWFVRWFEEMFSCVAAHEIYSRGVVNDLEIDRVREELRIDGSSRRFQG